MDESELDDKRPWSASSSMLDNKGFNMHEEPWEPPSRTNTGETLARLTDRKPTIPTIAGVPSASVRGSPTITPPPPLRGVGRAPLPRQYSGVSAVSVPIAFDGQLGGDYSVGMAR
jgi:hypothetical protein